MSEKDIRVVHTTAGGVAFGVLGTQAYRSNRLPGFLPPWYEIGLHDDLGHSIVALAGELDQAEANYASTLEFIYESHEELRAEGEHRACEFCAAYEEVSDDDHE